MPSTEHESLCSLFQKRPKLAVELVRDMLGIELPAHSRVRCDSENVSEVLATEYRADVVTVIEANERPVFAIIVEPQLGKDPTKPYTWPQYGAGVRARLKCQVLLLVVAPNHSVARWASRPIDMGPGSVFTPWVIGPSAIPVITDPKLAAKDRGLAVLSAMAHGRGNVETAVKVAFATLQGLRGMRNREDYVLYCNLVLSNLSAAARKALEMIPAAHAFKTPLIRESMKLGEAKGEAKGLAKGRTEGLAKGEAKGRAIGQVEGQAVSILEVFKARKLAVSAEQRKKILACQDRRQLATWLRRAVTVASAKELFTQ